MRSLVLVVGLIGLLLVGAFEANAADLEAKLDSNNGSSALSVKDSDNAEVTRIDSDGKVACTTINALTPTAQAVGFTLAGGTTSKTLTVTGDATISGTPSDANLVTSDITTNDVSITKHGFTPKAPNNTTTFLRGDATWATPAGGAPTTATYLTATAEAGLSAEVNLGALTSGLLKHTVTAGVSTPATAVAGTDYYNPGGTDVAVADGGTGASTKGAAFDALSPMNAVGDIIYGDTAGTGTRLAPNITTTKNFLTGTGTGAAGQAPVWGTIASGDLPATVVRTDQANTYTAGMKQTFQNSAATAGLNLVSSADPSTLAQGDVWINASDLKFRGAAATQTAERQANKGAASGYAGLGATSLVPTAQLGTGTASSSTYLRGDQTWQTPAGGSSYRTLVVNTVDTASTAATTFQNITELSFAVTAGTIYRWQATILYTTSAATIGIRIAPSGPAFTQNAYITETAISTTGSAAAGWHNEQTTLAAGTVSSASISTTGGNLITATGVYKPSSSGTFQLQFAPETATASGVVIQDGSTLEYW